MIRKIITATLFTLLATIAYSQCNPQSIDTDQDGICDLLDICPNLDDSLIGMACDDENPCTTNDVWVSSCDCEGTLLPDSDKDGVCDALDQCPNFDDELDMDDDGIPYCLDSCVDIDENDICDLNENGFTVAKQKIYFSHQRGFYENAFQLELVSNNPNATIKYSTNGDDPFIDGQVYTSPISINTTTPVRAVAYTATDKSKTKSNTFIFINDVLQQPNSTAGFPISTGLSSSITTNGAWNPQMETALKSIPTVCLSMDLDDYADIYATKGIEKFNNFEYFDAEGNSYGEPSSVNTYGNTSFSQTAKKNYRLKFKEATGESSFEHPIFGKDAADKFDVIDLRCGSQESIIRDGVQNIHENLLKDLQVDMSEYGPHTFFAHLYINGIYWGVYSGSERPNKSFGEAYFGGDKDDYNTIKGTCCSSSPVAIDGNNTTYNNLPTRAANYATVDQYLDIDHFIDYVLLCNYGPHGDWTVWNTYAMDNPTAGIPYRFFMWDPEPSLKNDWYYTDILSGTNQHNAIWNPLKANEEFRVRYGDNVQCECMEETGNLYPPNVEQKYEDLFNENKLAYLMEVARWKDLPLYNTFLAYKDDLINTNWFEDRKNLMINEYKSENLYPTTKAVIFSANEGFVETNSTLNLSHTNNGGTIYYTTDGSDPRLVGGAINPAATQGTSVTISAANTTVSARVLHNGVWSAMCPKTFFTTQNYEDLVINEIHYSPSDSIFYNPAINAQDTIDGKNFEFIELKNTGTTAINLYGSAFTKGIDLQIENQLIIPAGGFAVFAEDATWFQARYGFAPDGVYEGKLDDEGEKINLKNPQRYFIDTLRYAAANPWDEAADGSYFTLELLHSDLDNTEPLNWFRSDNSYGTPRAENSRTCDQSGIPIVINEINYNSDNDNFDPGDWIELYNPNNFPVDLSGWIFYDNNNAFVIPSGTIIGVDEYLVLIEDNALFTSAFPNVSNYIGEIGFSLSNKGERISLFDENKCLSDYVIYNDKAPWPTASDGDGATLALVAASLDNALASSWLASNILSSSFPNGSPGRPNDCAPNQPCCDGNANTINDAYDNNCNCIGTAIVGPPDLVLCDDGNPLTLYDVFDGNTCTCAGVIVSQTVCMKINNSLDDAEEQVTNGSMNLSSGDLDLGSDNGLDYLVGIRFQNSAIPQGATITSAYLQFTADEASGDATTIIIKGEAQNNPTAYTSTAYNISTRPTTGASASWTIPTWGTVGQRGVNQQSIDIGAVIQEIVNQQNYQAGNALGLMLSGSGERAADSFNGSAANAPELCVTYSTGQCVVDYPCDDGNPNTIADAFDANCNCVGTSILVQSKLLLEGFYESATGQMHTKLKDNNLLSLSQPYNTAPWNYTGTETVTTFPTGAVDWILVMVRDSNGNVIEQKSGFIHQSGNLIAIDGTQGIALQNGLGNKISIHHRSHLAVISSNTYTGNIYDFTTAANQAQGTQQLKLKSGKYMLHAGDFDGNGLINSSDFNDWKIQSAVLNQYLPIDGDGNGIINVADYNLWINNRSKVGEQVIRY